MLGLSKPILNLVVDSATRARYHRLEMDFAIASSIVKIKLKLAAAHQAPH